MDGMDMHAHMMNAADPLGTVIVIGGVIATVAAFVLAFRLMMWPGETSADHPKLEIFREDR